jgi:hypothetical protein
MGYEKNGAIYGRNFGLTQLSHDEEIFEPRTAGAGAPGRFSVRFRV